MSKDGLSVAELTEPRVAQSGPPKRGDFTYVDISSIDRETKRIVDPKVLPASKAPSRAKQLLQAGDVLVSMTRPNLNAVALVPPDLDGAIGSTGFHVLRAKEADPGFLYYAVQTNGFVEAMCRKVQGALYPAVRPKDISSFRLPQFSLDQQQHIVAEIDKQFTRLEAGLAGLRRVQANLKRYRAAVLKAACEGTLVPNEVELAKAECRKVETGAELLERILTERRKNWTGRGKYKEPVAPDTSDIPPPPKGWTWASVEQLATETVIGLDRGRAQQTPDPSGGAPYIKMNNVTMDGRVLYDNVVYVPTYKEEAERFGIRDGDILFNTRNSKELVGKVGIVRNPPSKAIYNNNLMRIRVSGQVMPEFLCLQMCSHDFRRRMELIKKATTNVAAVYAKDLLPLALALPPFAEQTCIVAELERRLSVIDELEAVVAANLQRAARLRQSILQRAFSGELVP